MIYDDLPAVYKRPWFFALVFSLVLHLVLFGLFVLFSSSFVPDRSYSDKAISLKLKLLKNEVNRRAYVVERADTVLVDEAVGRDTASLNGETHLRQESLGAGTSDSVNVQAFEGVDKNSKTLIQPTSTAKTKLDSNSRNKKLSELGQHQVLNSRELLEAFTDFDGEQLNKWPVLENKDSIQRPFDPRHQTKLNKAQRLSKTINSKQSSQSYLNRQGQRVVEHKGRCMTLKEDLSTGQSWWTLPVSCSATEADLLLLDLKRRLAQ